MLVIDGVTMPGIVSYDVDVRDIDGENSLTTEAGVEHRDRLRAGVYTIDVAFAVTKADHLIIAAALAPASMVVVFFDPNTVSTQTATMKAGNRKSSLVVAHDENDSGKSYWRLSVTLSQF